MVSFWAMTRAKLRLAIVTWMLGALSLQCSAPRDPDGQLVGQPAPAFELRDLEGHRVSLDQLRGKIIMLDFWATWCGPCQISMPIMDRLQKEFSGDVVLLAIDVMEPEETVREYVSRQNVRSKVLLDPEGSVGEVYGSGAIPMQVIIDQQGVVQHVNVGLSPRREASLREQINRLRATN
jgi:thiol-disulfide isomerase/thioredoxin